jgi:hypothetical protein
MWSFVRSGPDTNGLKELMDSVGTPSPCLPIACPKNTDGLACNADQLKNCKAIAGNFFLLFFSTLTPHLK